MAERARASHERDGKQPRPSQAELGRCLQALRPRLTAVALRFARSPDSADDIVQNAFEKVWRRLDQFDGRARFSTWVHRIVVNEALMWLRSERRRDRHQLDVALRGEALAVQHPDPAEQLSARQQRARVRASIALLPAPDRELITACVIDEVPYEDFCARTGIGAAAAKSRAFRARQRLRRMLAEAS